MKAPFVEFFCSRCRLATGRSRANLFAIASIGAICGTPNRTRYATGYRNCSSLYETLLYWYHSFFCVAGMNASGRTPGRSCFVDRCEPALG